jgi:putative hydrolase of the HAD superfamily
MAIRAVISDFGGVLTSPLEPAMQAVFEAGGMSLAELGESLPALTAQQGVNPLHELESGRLAQDDFLAMLTEDIGRRAGRPVSLEAFSDNFFGRLSVNEPFLAFLRELRGRGYAMALCTNNVREWERHWRAMVPIEELFDVVIDSSAVGSRKPEPRIYALTLERLGVEAGEAVFIDDLAVNCDAAAQLGLHPVRFDDAEQAIADVESILRDAG